MEKKMKELTRKSECQLEVDGQFYQTGGPFQPSTYLLNRFGALGGFFNVFGPFLAAVVLAWTGSLVGSIKGPPATIESPLGIVPAVQIGCSAEHGRRRMFSWVTGVNFDRLDQSAFKEHSTNSPYPSLHQSDNDGYPKQQ